MSNLGFQGIYNLLNKRTDIVCERAFLPDEEEVEEYIRTKTPIFSLESKMPLENFKIIAFSISFENDYPNILRILKLSNIPFFSSNRNKYHPLLIAGGACMCFNPEPVASVFDLIFIGEAEESLIEFMDLLNGRGSSKAQYSGKMQNGLKKEIKKSALNIRGVYVPDFYEIQYNHDRTISGRTSSYNALQVIERRYISNLDKSQISHVVLTPETEFANMHLIEVMRGCQWNCRFCMVGHVFNPPRKKSPEAIKAEILRDGQSSSRVGLIGPSLSDYPGIEDILSIGGVDFSITSLRANTRSTAIIGLMKGHRSISIAPEAGSQRLRNAINKKISESEILETSVAILGSGIEALRLYFMIGLPTETIADISAIVELVRKIRALSDRGNVILSISAFVPKPFTPFQWCSMDTVDSLTKKLKYIKKALSAQKGIRVFHDLPKYALMQGLFSLGDRRVMNVLQMMTETDNWQKAALLANVNIDYYLFREKGYDENLPWDFIDSKISKKKLWDEYTEAMQAG